MWYPSYAPAVCVCVCVYVKGPLAQNRERRVTWRSKIKGGDRFFRDGVATTSKNAPWGAALRPLVRTASWPPFDDPIGQFDPARTAQHSQQHARSRGFM